MAPNLMIYVRLIKRSKWKKKYRNQKHSLIQSSQVRFFRNFLGISDLTVQIRPVCLEQSRSVSEAISPYLSPNRSRYRYCALCSTSENYINQKHVSSAEAQIPKITVLRNYFFETEARKKSIYNFQVQKALSGTTKVLDQIVHGSTVQHLSHSSYAHTVPKQLLHTVAQKVKFNNFHPSQHEYYSKLTV